MINKQQYSFKGFFTFLIVWVFGVLSSHAQSPKYAVKPVLTGMMATTTNADKWFKDITSWGITGWECFAPHYRAQLFRLNVDERVNGELLGNDTTIPWLEELMPEFRSAQNQEQYQWQEAMILKAYNGCVTNSIDFNYGYPFPIFPVQEVELVKKLKPELFDPKGKLIMTHPFLRDLMKNHLRLLKKKLPLLKGVTVWMCEGNGELVKFDDYDLQHNKEWLDVWVSALSEVCTELKIQGTVFAHDYFHTYKTHRHAFEALAKYPNIIVMEDNTWPEENTLCPPFAFIPESDQKNLFASNPISQNILTDCEYLGQGFYPCLLPRWWKKSVNEGLKKGVDVVNGRTFFWDRGCTDINFDRMNAFMLTRFCYTPDADPKKVLTAAVHEYFGDNVPNALIDIFYETEPLLQKIVGINGTSSLNHSAFPKAKFLDKDYFNNVRYMKAVDDLFQKPGTPLYPAVNDEIDAALQWRVQNAIFSKPVESYLKEKNEAIDWLEKVVPQLPKLTKNLPKEKADFITESYHSIYILAKGMKLFVATGKVHYDWYRAKTLTENEAKEKFNTIANQLQQLAAERNHLPLNLNTDILKFASDIRIITKVRPNN